MEVGRVQDAKGKAKKGKERKDKEIRKGRKLITRAKVKAKTKKTKVWQHATLVENLKMYIDCV